MRALGEGGVVGVLECATHSGDAAAVLKLAHKYPFVHAALGIHPESLGEEDAAWLTAQGMALGFGGAVTYKGAKRAAKVLAMVPHELAVLETDCPYMSPEPVRGTRNDSRNIAHVAAKIGEIWQMDAQSVLDLTAENAKRIFNQ